MSHKIKVDVRRASHTHHAPQIGRAHNGPVIKTNEQKITPISAEASAYMSHSLSFFHKNKILLIKTMKKEREWDIYALASAEIGVIFCSLVLITGPIWARPIWGAWWVWDARLTSTLILWLIYVSYLMLRYQTDVGSMRARFAAVLGIVGFLDIPFIHFSVLWWRTFHPPPKMISPEGLGAGMDPSMVTTLMLSLGAFTLLYFVLMGQRIKVEKMRDEVERLKKDYLYTN